MKNSKYKINNKLIRKALFGGMECEYLKLSCCDGYINNDTYKIGRALISYCISRNFGIHRIYGFEESYLNDSDKVKRNEAFIDLTIEELDDACKELQSLYEFTQNYLKNSSNIKNGKIMLSRSLSSFEIESISRQINNKTIIMNTNIISSYTDNGMDFEYGSCVTVRREVPIEDIVIHYDCLEYPRESCHYGYSGGESEIWVMNKDIKGKLELDSSKFTINEDALKLKYLSNNPEVNYFKYTQYAENDYYKDKMYHLEKPCEKSKIIKCLIKMKQAKNNK